MFAGHVGAALALGRADRRVNLGVLVFAALLLDVALWLFVLAGWESVTIPASFAATHQPQYRFPYSHGLVASIVWSVVAAAMVYASRARCAAVRRRAAALVGAAVFSHWLLDALVHQAELPLVGGASPKVGLGLWQDMPVALIVEAALVALGLALFLPRSGLSRARSLSLAVVSLVVLALTVAGMTVAPPPPSALAMAASSLATILVVCGLMAWLGAPASRGPA